MDETTKVKTIVAITFVIFTVAILWLEWIAIAWLLMMVFSSAPWFVIVFFILLVNSILFTLHRAMDIKS